MVQTLSTTQTEAALPTRKQQIVAHLLGNYRQVGELRRSVVRVRLRIQRCRFVTKFELEDLGVTVEDDTVRDLRVDTGAPRQEARLRARPLIARGEAAPIAPPRRALHSMARRVGGRQRRSPFHG